MKVIIVGGGIAGISAGIYGQMMGYDCEIIEKNSCVGGECTGWRRGDFYIDNCIHWLMGTKKDTELYDAWRQVGALNDSMEIYYPDAFYISEYQGQTIAFWKDLNKTKADMLRLSPEDKKQICAFFRGVKKVKNFSMPVKTAPEMMNKMQLIKLGLPMLKIRRAMKKYDRITVSDYADSFRHPLLKRAFKDYLSVNSSASSLFTSYATFVQGDGGIPKGFSAGLPRRMAEKFTALGGKITCNTAALEVKIENGAVKGVITEKGEYPCDKIIFATDFAVTYSLLGAHYRQPALKKALENPDLYPVHGEFQIAFYSDEPLKNIESTFVFETDEMLIGTRKFTRLGIRAYDYDAFAPQGKHLYQCLLVQYKEDYEFWKALAEKKDGSYERTKQAHAKTLVDQIEKYTGTKIHLIDTWTPYTYYKWCGAYLGSYMAFMRTPTSKMPWFSAKVEGLSNAYLASQWQRAPGGLATALTMGKFAVQRLARDDGK